MGMLTDNKQETIDSLKRAGFNDQIIPALMANIDVETGGTYSHTQIQKDGNGYGLFQFTGTHLTDYKEWLKNSNLSDSKDSQAKFVYDNIYASKGYGHELGWRARSKLQAINEEKMNKNPHIENPTRRRAKIFSDIYERPPEPHMDRRLLSADEWEKVLYPKK
jgi:hypothetical protein